MPRDLPTRRDGVHARHHSSGRLEDGGARCFCGSQPIRCVGETVERLLRQQQVAIVRAEDRATQGPWWYPARHVRSALRSLEELDAVEHSDAAAGVARDLLGAAAELWWPMHMRGELQISPDEMPWVQLEEVGFCPMLPVSSMQGADPVEHLRHEAVELLAVVELLELRSAEGVTFDQVDAVAEQAARLAVLAAAFVFTGLSWSL